MSRPVFDQRFQRLVIVGFRRVIQHVSMSLGSAPRSSNRRVTRRGARHPRRRRARFPTRAAGWCSGSKKPVFALAPASSSAVAARTKLSDRAGRAEGTARSRGASARPTRRGHSWPWRSPHHARCAARLVVAEDRRRVDVAAAISGCAARIASAASSAPCQTQASMNASRASSLDMSGEAQSSPATPRRKT